MADNEDNPFSSIPTQQPAEGNPFADIPQNQPTPWYQNLAKTFNPIVPAAALFSPAVAQQGLQTEMQAAERYPQGIMQTAQDLSQGKTSDMLQNFFSPKPNVQDAIAIAQDIGDKTIPPAVIANPDSHLDYLKAFSTNFIKDLPFTTMGVTSEFANPNNAFLAGAITHMPNVNIPAPQWVDSAISKIIDFAGGPFSSLNNALKDKLADHLADTIHDKVQNAPGWLDQFKRVYGEDTTTEDVRDLIKNKVDQVVQNTSPNAIDLAKAIIKTKGQNLPGVMVPSKEIAPPGAPIMADQYAVAPQGPLQEKPIGEFAPATIDTVGREGETSSKSVEAMDPIQRGEHLARLQVALDKVQEYENQRAIDLASKGIPTPPLQLPQAQNLDKVMQEQLLTVAKNEIAKPDGNDQSVQKALLKAMGRDEEGKTEETKRTVSAITMNQNKEEAGSTPVWDWNKLKNITIDELAQQLKNENIQREASGMPLIEPRIDLEVHKHTYEGQPRGIENQVREAILRAYDRSPAPPEVSKVEPTNPFSQIPSATSGPGGSAFYPVPVPVKTPSAEEAAGRVIEKMKQNPALAKPVTQPNVLSAPEIPPTTSLNRAIKLAREPIAYPERVRVTPGVPKPTVSDLTPGELNYVVTTAEKTRVQQAKLASSIIKGDEMEEKMGISAKDILAEPKIMIKSENEVILGEVRQMLADWSEGVNTAELWMKKEQVANAKRNVFKNKQENRYKTDTYREDFGIEKDVWEKEQTPEEKKRQRELLDKDIKKLDEATGFLGKVYSQEIEEHIWGTKEAKKIPSYTVDNAVHEVLKSLRVNSRKPDIDRAISKLDYHIREAQRSVDVMKRKAQEDEMKAAGRTWNLPDQEVDKEAATEPVNPAEHLEDGEAQDKEVKFDNAMEKEVDDEGELVYMADPIKMMKDAFLVSPKVVQRGQEPRECAAPALLAFMRQNPFIAKLDDWFTFKMGGDKAMELKALMLKERYSSGEALDAIQHFAMYEGAVEGIVRSELQPIYNDLEAQVKQFFKQHPMGIKLQGKEALQKVVDKYSSLLAEASEQVMVKPYDIHSYAHSELGNGPHKDSFEADAYVKAMKEWYEFFKKPYTQADIIRWTTQRTPDIWNLLKDPLVMNSDKLQRMVLFYKAQIEMPMLIEQIKNGIFANADIWKSIVEGYHMKNFALKGEQENLLSKVKDFFLPKSPLGNIKMPQARYSSQQAFKQAGETESWRPINDFFLDNAEYMKRAMLSIKQAQLLKEISSLPLPKLEFFSPKFTKALTDHPIPEEWNQQLKKVHASTDQVITNIANHMTHAMFTPAEIQKGIDIEKQTGKNPYSVTPMTVLTEGGWVQSHQDDGLNKWYRGSFQPPFVYKTLYDMIKTVYRTSSGFDTLPGFLQLYMTGKQMLLIDPIVHAPQYVGNVIMTMPFYSVPGQMMALPVKSTVSFFKGLAKTGPDILAGNYTKDIGTTPEERQWARAFIEHGATMVGGYNVFLHNMIGKADKGLFPQRQNFGDNLRDYLLSGFGTGPSVLGEMIGQHALKVMIEMTKNYIKQGMDPESAIRTTVYRCNTAMNNLNHVSWQGSRLGSFLALATYSKNFAVGATRMMMMASQSPIGGALMGGLTGAAVGGPVGMAIGGAAGARVAAWNKLKFRNSGSGAGTNALLGTDIPTQYRDQLNSDMLKGVAMMLFWTTMFYGITQYALSQMAKEEDREPGDEFWWNNPVPMVGSLKLFMKNVDNQPIFAVYNGFRLGKDQADQLAPLINQAGKNLTGNKDFDLGGKGPVKYTADKFGAALSYVEALVNNKFLTDNSKVWDTDEKEQWKQAAQAISYIAGKNVPINPWLGASAMKTPLTDDKFINMLMESATLYGVQYKTGVPAGSGVSEAQAEKWRADVRHEEYEAKEGKNPFVNFMGGRNLSSPDAIEKAREKGEITQRQYINFFKKQNPNYYFKQNRKKIWAAAEEENSSSVATEKNPFDEIESPENF